MPTSAMWKNMTFAVGLAWLIWGALFFGYPDWDIGLSLLMAGCTYLTADKFVASVRQAIVTKRPSWALAVGTLGAWVSIDGVYWLYWSVVDPSVSIRDAQWPTSACLYLLCGLIWYSLDPAKLPADLRQRMSRSVLSGRKRP